jgi:hypothetical protein
MQYFFEHYYFLQSNKKLVRALKSMTWIDYLLIQTKSKSVSEFIRTIKANDPKIRHALDCECNSGFLNRKKRGEQLRNKAKIANYEQLVPSSKAMLHHPLFAILSTSWVWDWGFRELILEFVLDGVAEKQSKVLKRMAIRLSKGALRSPLKLTIIKTLIKDSPIDNVTSLLFLYLLCQTQYVRPSFFRVLEKSLLRAVVKLFYKGYNKKWALPLIKAINQILVDVQIFPEIPYRELNFQTRKKRYAPIFFRRVETEQRLLKLITNSQKVDSTA